MKILCVVVAYVVFPLQGARVRNNEKLQKSFHREDMQMEEQLDLGSWPCRVDDDSVNGGKRDAWVIVRSHTDGESDAPMEVCPDACNGECTVIDWDALPKPMPVVTTATTVESSGDNSEEALKIPDTAAENPAPGTSTEAAEEPVTLNSCCCKQGPCVDRDDGVTRNSHEMQWQERNTSAGELLTPSLVDFIFPFSGLRKLWQARNLLTYHKEVGPVCCKLNDQCDMYFGYPQEVTKDFCEAKPAESSDSWYPLGDKCVIRPIKMPPVVYKSMDAWDGRLMFMKRTGFEGSICTKEYRTRCLGRELNQTSGTVVNEGHIAMVMTGSCVHPTTNQPIGIGPSGNKIRYFGAYSNSFHDSTEICTEYDSDANRLAMAVEHMQPGQPPQKHWLSTQGACLTAEPVDAKSGIELSEVTDEMLQAISRTLLEMVFVAGYVPACMCCTEKLSFMTKMLYANSWLKKECKLAYALGLLNANSTLEPENLAKADASEATSGHEEAEQFSTEERAVIAAAGAAAAAEKYGKLLASTLIPVVGSTLVNWGKYYMCQAACSMRQSPQFDRYNTPVLRSIPGRAAATWLVPIR